MGRVDLISITTNTTDTQNIFISSMTESNLSNITRQIVCTAQFHNSLISGVQIIYNWQYLPKADVVVKESSLIMEERLATSP